jgi:hypothetical protein
MTEPTARVFSLHGAHIKLVPYFVGAIRCAMNMRAGTFKIDLTIIEDGRESDMSIPYETMEAVRQELRSVSQEQRLTCGSRYPHSAALTLCYELGRLSAQLKSEDKIILCTTDPSIITEFDNRQEKIVVLNPEVHADVVELWREREKSLLDASRITVRTSIPVIKTATDPYLAELSVELAMPEAVASPRALTPEPPAPEPLAPEPLAPEPLAPEPPAPEPLAPEPPAPEPPAPEPPAPEPPAPEPLAPEPPAPEPLALELPAPEPLALEPPVPEPLAPEPSAPEPTATDLVEMKEPLGEPDSEGARSGQSASWDDRYPQSREEPFGDLIGTFATSAINSV